MDSPCAAGYVDGLAGGSDRSAVVYAIPIDLEVIETVRAIRFQIVGHGQGHGQRACLFQCDDDGGVLVVAVVSRVAGAYHCSAVAVD